MYSGTLESQLGLAAQQQQQSQQQHHHNGDFVLQKYLLLQNQHDELQQHMHELCPLYTTNSSSTAVTSPSSSPTRMLNPRSSNSSISSASSTGSLSPPRSRQHRRRSSIPPASNGACGVYSQLAPVLDEEVMHEMAADEQMLCDVNEGIKRALTELLNCDKVRQDRAMRSWVQTRLMDTERELRTGRRRRSNGGPVDSVY
ncbi:hypothetical protein PG993_012670 [Apiospora rasikravindrae]|uniref:Uncharacterized protein n=1 Tax=Apiospora rasikravindrae TaxID=990691 RepID=A0ABR1S5D4_9PEZI